MFTMLEEAVTHIRAGNIEKATPLLIEFLKQNPQSEDAWLWMSRCVTEPEQKKFCFEKVLKINPQNQHAIKGLERLNNPASTITQPRIKAVQQPFAQQKPKKSNSAIIILAVIGLSIFAVVSVCGIAWLFFSTSNNPSSSNQVNNPAPTHRVRPNYKQMLEANGFVYSTNDKDGDPLYVSPCGCVVAVKPDYMGFGAYYDPDNGCAIEDLGAIVSVMYPSEVIDFTVSNIHSVISDDKTVHGTVAGYKINIDFDPYDPKLVMTIHDP